MYCVSRALRRGWLTHKFDLYTSQQGIIIVAHKSVYNNIKAVTGKILRLKQ